MSDGFKEYTFGDWVQMPGWQPPLSSVLSHDHWYADFINELNKMKANESVVLDKLTGVVLYSLANNQTVRFGTGQSHNREHDVLIDRKKTPWTVTVLCPS